MRQFAALVVLGVLSAGLWASDNPAVAQLKKEVDALEAQRKATIKKVHDWYEGMIKHDKLNKETLVAERKALGEQENELLKTASTQEGKTAIKNHFESLRALLKEDAKMDADTIRQLRKHEKEHETVIRNSFDSAIQALKAQEKSLAGVKPK